MRVRCRGMVAVYSLLCGLVPVFAQLSVPTPLDPVRMPVVLHAPPANHLTEQFIWTAGDAAALDPKVQAAVRGQEDKIVPHYFRGRFQVRAVPPHAMLYLAGPRSAIVTLNGTPVLHFEDNSKRGKGFNVFAVNVTHALQPGNNVVAVEEVRGHSSLHTGASPTINQVTYGEVLLLKIVPRERGLDATPLAKTGGTWRSTLTPGSGWQLAGFDDSSWRVVQALGVPGTRSDFLQWNADAGLYAWPGYTGISAALRTFRLPALSVRDLDALPATTHLTPSGGLSLLPTGTGSALTLDFGRELSGRVHLVSAQGEPVEVETSYGESAEEALRQPYLGVRTVYLPARAEAFGPKSAFRYVRLRFPAEPVRLARVEVEGITDSVAYKGSFTSSDPLVNRIWETAAYTAHLCLQEGIWDAPKRDRGRWMGDLDVTGRTVNSIFAERTLMEKTMTAVVGDLPVERDVNTIAGYSALWITGQADFLRHTGDLAYLRAMQSRLLGLLAVMRAELNADGLFTNPGKHKVFVDWSPGYSADTPDARAATHFEFLAAFREAAFLLDALGDTTDADAARKQAATMLTAAQTLLSPDAATFGTRWQTNAAAVVAGAASGAQAQAIWRDVLARTAHPAATDIVTPYYGFYVLSAMAHLGHRPEALEWMRLYWGGMLAEGATSFWEAYDPRWPKDDFHAHLQADGKTGYYVSLAHGWASGPAAWLMEQVLGIQPTAAGFAAVTLRPDLAGLAWARGSEPTPRGLLRMDVAPRRIRIELPPGIVATALLPFQPGRGSLFLDGRAVVSTPDSTGTRSVVVLRSPGVHQFVYQEDAR